MVLMMVTMAPSGAYADTLTSTKNQEQKFKKKQKSVFATTTKSHNCVSKKTQKSTRKQSKTKNKCVFANTLLCLVSEGPNGILYVTDYNLIQIIWTTSGTYGAHSGAGPFVPWSVIFSGFILICRFCRTVLSMFKDKTAGWDLLLLNILLHGAS